MKTNPVQGNETTRDRIQYEAPTVIILYNIYEQNDGHNDEKYAIDTDRSANAFPVTNMPNQNTRRHYKSIAHLKNANIWKYDPEPKAKIAGLPNKDRDYNPINGETGPVPLSLVKSSTQERLPDFMQNKFEVDHPMAEACNNLYDKIRNQGHLSKIFY